MSTAIPEVFQAAKGRVLVVDDERFNRLLLHSLLQGAGYQVAVAENGESALQQIGANNPDVILLDVVMPGLDGYTVCRRIKEDPTTSHLPVLIVTALNDREARLQGIGAGASDFLSKPIDHQEVLLRVHNAVYAKRLFDENLSYQRDLEKKVIAQTQQLRQAHTRLEKQVRELEGRDRLVHLQTSESGLAVVTAEMLQIFSQVIDVAQVIIYRPVGRELKAVAALGVSSPGCLANENQVRDLPALPKEEGQALATQVFRSGQPGRNGGGQAAAPLLYRDEVLGVVCLAELAGEAAEDKLNALWRLSREAALVLHAIQITEALGEVQDLESLIDLEGDK